MSLNLINVKCKIKIHKILIFQSHASLSSQNQDLKIAVIGSGENKKRVTIDENTYTLSDPTVSHVPGNYSTSYCKVGAQEGTSKHFKGTSLKYRTLSF